MDSENTQQIKPNQGHPAKFAFFYGLSLVSLIIMSVAAGNILFQIINEKVVDKLENFGGCYWPQEVRMWLSALIISAPIYYLVSTKIYKSLYSGELKEDSVVRKWLSYFILLISSVVSIGWLIATLNSFLNGELSLKFGLKALVALLISGSIFYYYLHEVNRRQLVGVSDKVSKIFFTSSLLAVLVLAGVVFAMFESPTKSRQRRADELVINDFNILASRIDDFYARRSQMPKDLEELKEGVVGVEEGNLFDRETGKKYEYKALDGEKYQLCADFKTSNKQNNSRKQCYSETDLHDSGWQCLTKQVAAKPMAGEVKEAPRPIK